jgi:hypothetical protein
VFALCNWFRVLISVIEPATPRPCSGLLVAVRSAVLSVDFDLAERSFCRGSMLGSRFIDGGDGFFVRSFRFGFLTISQSFPFLIWHNVCELCVSSVV